MRTELGFVDSILLYLEERFTSTTNQFFQIISTLFSIFGLLFSRRPFAIILRIISPIINTFYRCVFLSKLLNVYAIKSIHIVLEFNKRLPKTFSTFPSIVFPTNIMSIVASTFDIIKGLIEFWLVSFGRETVYKITHVINVAPVRKNANSLDSVIKLR